MVDDTLEERGQVYGEFKDNGRIAQLLKNVARGSSGWMRLQHDQKEALEMILHKIARIVNGDPNYVDSWTDIAGYARLIERRLEQEDLYERPLKHSD